MKAINQVSLLQSVVLSSQLKEMLGSLGSSPGTMRLVYNQREPFFVSRTVRLCNSCAHNKLTETTIYIFRLSEKYNQGNAQA